MNFDRIGNTRVGLARWPGLSLDCGLHSKDLQGEAWFVDYDGIVKHNRRGVVSGCALYDVTTHVRGTAEERSVCICERS